MVCSDFDLEDWIVVVFIFISIWAINFLIFGMIVEFSLTVFLASFSSGVIITVLMILFLESYDNPFLQRITNDLRVMTKKNFWWILFSSKIYEIPTSLRPNDVPFIIVDWCEKNCKGQFCQITPFKLKFQLKRDLMATKLRWE